MPFYLEGHIREMGDVSLSPLRGNSKGVERKPVKRQQEGFGWREAGLPKHGGQWAWGEAPQVLGLTTGCVERAALGGGHPEVG